jgi:hypothetical protein
VHDHSGPERLRSLLLQVVLVGLVLVAGLTIFETVADATTSAGQGLTTAEP